MKSKITHQRFPRDGFSVCRALGTSHLGRAGSSPSTNPHFHFTDVETEASAEGCGVPGLTAVRNNTSPSRLYPGCRQSPRPGCAAVRGVADPASAASPPRPARPTCRGRRARQPHPLPSPGLGPPSPRPPRGGRGSRGHRSHLRWAPSSRRSPRGPPGAWPRRGRSRAAPQAGGACSHASAGVRHVTRTSRGR